LTRAKRSTARWSNAFPLKKLKKAGRITCPVFFYSSQYFSTLGCAHDTVPCHQTQTDHNFSG
jgi:hypothetical protein